MNVEQEVTNNIFWDAAMTVSVGEFFFASGLGQPIGSCCLQWVILWVFLFWRAQVEGWKLSEIGKRFVQISTRSSLSVLGCIGLESVSRS